MKDRGDTKPTGPKAVLGTIQYPINTASLPVLCDRGGKTCVTKKQVQTSGAFVFKTTLASIHVVIARSHSVRSVFLAIS